MIKPRINNPFFENIFCHPDDQIIYGKVINNVFKFEKQSWPVNASNGFYWGQISKDGFKLLQKAKEYSFEEIETLFLEWKRNEKVI